MALIHSSDYDNLPPDPAQRWLKLRDMVELRLSNKDDPNEGTSVSDLIEYWSVLASAAEELNLGVLTRVSVGNVRENFDSFRSEVIELATRLSLRISTSDRALSVALKHSTRAKINVQIESLRKLVADSDLDADRKKKLAAKLDELHLLVTASRTDFGKVLAVVAYITLAIGSTTAFLADAPDAITTITALIGADKESEDEEQSALEADKKPLSIPDLRQETDSDEIPF